MIGFRTQIELQITDRIAAIGEKLDLLIGLHSMRLSVLEEPAPGLVVISLDKGKGLA
jgi:hypothetical protein